MKNWNKIYPFEGDGALIRYRNKTTPTSCVPGLIVLAMISLLTSISGCALTSASSPSPKPTSVLTVGKPTLPQPQVQSGYLGFFTASGGEQPYTWDIKSGSLPTGLALTASTGTISGTPTQTGTSTFTIEVRDASSPVATASAPMSLSVIAEPNLQASSAGLPSGLTQVNYTANLSASGGISPYSWSLTSGQLPAGLNLSSSGAITGIPTTAGQSKFTAQVTDSSSPNMQTASGSFQITISAQTTTGPYTSRTDFSLIPVPVPLPSVGGATGAGTCITEPGYNNLVCRATDINTLGATASANNQEFSTCCGGWGDHNAWNTTSTMFFASTNGGNVAVMSFDPTTHAIAPLYGQPVPGGEWSHINSDVAYSFTNSNDPVIASRTFSSQTTPPQPVVIADLATVPNCVPALAGSVLWKEMSVSRDEQTFVVGASTGPQDTAIYAIIYNRTKGCRWYNTQTGQIGGNWGPIGQATTSDRYTLHSIRISGDGQTVFLGPAASSNAGRQFWTIDTLQVVSPGAEVNTGHFAIGFSGMLNSAGLTAAHEWCKLGMAYRTFAALSSPIFIIPSVAQCGNTGIPGDDHSSWNNDDTSDDQPFFTSTVNPTPINSAWQNEILGFSRTSPGTVWRFLSTYNTGTSTFFTCQNGIGTVSQDGKWFVFTSDWGNTLGLDSAGNRRCDVFVGQLK